MKINDILLRLERYSKPIARFMQSVAKILRVSEWRLKIYVGEMQAFARPMGEPGARSGQTKPGISAPFKLALRSASGVGSSESAAHATNLAIESSLKTTPVKDILDIVCCPNCQSEIQLFEESEAICTQCEQSFEVDSGVINFSRYAKHKKRKIIGSS